MLDEQGKYLAIKYPQPCGKLYFLVRSLFDDMLFILPCPLFLSPTKPIVHACTDQSVCNIP